MDGSPQLSEEVHGIAPSLCGVAARQQSSALLQTSQQLPTPASAQLSPLWPPLPSAVLAPRGEAMLPPHACTAEAPSAPANTTDMTICLIAARAAILEESGRYYGLPRDLCVRHATTSSSAHHGSVSFWNCIHDVSTIFARL